MSVTETERAWLAGIWDGEGSLALFTNHEKNGSLKIKPVANMVNTDYGIINRAHDIMVRGGCNPYVVNRRQSAKNLKHKDVIELKCSSVPTIEALLSLITPYLCGVKKQKAEILLRYVQRRKEKFANGDRSYEDEDFTAVEQIRSSETTRETPESNCTIW